LVCGIGDYEAGQYEEDDDSFAAIMSKDRINFHELKAGSMEQQYSQSRKKSNKI